MPKMSVMNIVKAIRNILPTYPVTKVRKMVKFNINEKMRRNGR